MWQQVLSESLALLFTNAHASRLTVPLSAFTCFFMLVKLQLCECDYTDTLSNWSTCHQSTLAVIWVVCQCSVVKALPNRLLNKMCIQSLSPLSLLSVLDWGASSHLASQEEKQQDIKVLVAASFCLRMYTSVCLFFRWWKISSRSVKGQLWIKIFSMTLIS